MWCASNVDDGHPLKAAADWSFALQWNRKQMETVCSVNSYKELPIYSLTLTSIQVNRIHLSKVLR